jgi:transposase
VLAAVRGSGRGRPGEILDRLTPHREQIVTGLADGLRLANRVYGLLVALRFSRYAFLAITLRQDLAAALDGLESAWVSFSGVVKRLVEDNLKPAVARADRRAPFWEMTPALRSGHLPQGGWPTGWRADSR